MNRPQVKTTDILGERKPCYFSSQGERPFKYSDKCRDCNPLKPCENYISSHINSPLVASPERTDKDSKDPIIFTSQDAYVPMIIRNNEFIIRKTSKLLDLIRRATDGMVI